MKRYHVKVGDRYIREEEYKHLVEVDNKKDASSFSHPVAVSISDYLKKHTDKVTIERR